MRVLAVNSRLFAKDSGDRHQHWRFHLKQEHQRDRLTLEKKGVSWIKRLLCARCFTTLSISA
ncbi:MAG: hypothetical protein F6K31_13995 [Symploca sp. SIO2G7]|nr:hypothetical protein [Symploca sp. SIO2G7]